VELVVHQVVEEEDVDVDVVAVEVVVEEDEEEVEDVVRLKATVAAAAQSISFEESMIIIVANIVNMVRVGMIVW